MKENSPARAFKETLSLILPFKFHTRWRVKTWRLSQHGRHAEVFSFFFFCFTQHAEVQNRRRMLTFSWETRRPFWWYKSVSDIYNTLDSTRSHSQGRPHPPVTKSNKHESFWKGIHFLIQRHITQNKTKLFNKSGWFLYFIFGWSRALSFCTLLSC